MAEERENNYKTQWTVYELSQKTGLSMQYIRILLRAGTIRGSKPGGRDWIVLDSDARRWLEQWREARDD